MVFVWYTMSFVAAALVFFLDYIRLFWQRYMCYDVIKTMLFVIIAASFVLFGDVICTVMSSKRRYLLPISRM